MKITQTKDIRTANRLTILNHVIRNHAVSRAEISEQTGLNKATVSTIVKEWIDLHILVETERGSSTGGRKPIILNQIPDSGYCIAIDMDISKFKIIVTDLCNQIIQTVNIPLIGNQFTTNYKQLYTTLDRIVSSMSPSCYGLVGIGVSVRGIVDLDGVIRFIPNLHWRNIDIKNLLQERYHVPVFVDNDGNLAALSEWHHHVASHDLVLLNIDDVLSTGVILNGSVLRGNHGFANAVGHHTVNFTESRQCHCGKHGCLEQYCSHRAILEEWNCLSGKSISRIEEFIALVKIQDAVALDVLDRFMHHLAIGLSNIVFFLDCEIIVLNSVILTALPYLVPQILQKIILPITQTQDIMISTLGQDAAILGASDHCIRLFFHELASGDASAYE